MARPSHSHVKHEGASLTDAARDVLLNDGEQWTEMRAQVFDVLAEFTKPASAYDIAEQLGKMLGRRVAPNSIYRILDLFVAHNLALRVESRNAYLANDHPGCIHDCIFLVCDDCGATTHIDDDETGKTVRKAASQDGFRVKRPVIEVRGQCTACSEA
ncbi:transcriptional repressor [Sphingobium sp. TA15]|uniref:Fur-family ferric uptake regulator n=1 Tax=Sphingobium indicum (strain DSM 16413 / CCM 7287 / MTCC 6362 / UT26 / NBRC 101211 / UT26S) TaxID=452662 RepID=D4Z290_SPHIU|nr:transcriptional repressor [Sphingobium indicum]BAI96722.1 Fur-family ferric uptake regulator [Sphingobium indicum UT26S]BDD66157.1 transcriptional repressor [Sphingobium sp. TA15]